MLRNALIFLAPGFEELEALAPVDVLRRAGVPVTLAGLSPDAHGCVSSSRGVGVRCDVSVQELPLSGWDLVYFPGGMPGSRNLAAEERCREAARQTLRGGGWVCAICAAPLALDAAGLLEGGVEYTCYPGTERQISHGVYTGKYIQRSGRILTACGPAAALDFSLEILRATGAASLATQLSEAMGRR
ncbi:MAG: DJ-1 family glyoxalase III [Oligosphaeraceae bacterium]